MFMDPFSNRRPFSASSLLTAPPVGGVYDDADADACTNDDTGKYDSFGVVPQDHSYPEKTSPCDDSPCRSSWSAGMSMWKAWAS